MAVTMLVPTQQQWIVGTPIPSGLAAIAVGTDWTHPLVFTATGLPVGVSMDTTGVFSGTPLLTQTIAVVVVKVTDANELSFVGGFGVIVFENAADAGSDSNAGAPPSSILAGPTVSPGGSSSGGTSTIAITAHGIASDAAPTVTEGGTSSNPTFDIGIPSASSALIDEYVASVAGAQTRTYSSVVSASARVYINGIKQAATEFTIAGDAVVLPATLSIQVGDLVQLEH